MTIRQQFNLNKEHVYLQDKYMDGYSFIEYPEHKRYVVRLAKFAIRYYRHYQSYDKNYLTCDTIYRVILSYPFLSRDSYGFEKTTNYVPAEIKKRIDALCTEYNESFYDY